MKAMLLARIGPIGRGGEPLDAAEIPAPEAGRGEVLVRVSVCGVCHTELDEIEGRTPPPSLPVVPGHEAVGRVVSLGAGVANHRVGDRVGVGWIHHSSGAADENLDPAFRATGRDADGGYAEYLAVPADYAYPIPDVFSDEEAAPLLCAGAVGYRALKLTGVTDGAALGLTGFGGSAHLVLQFVRHHQPNTRVHVFARDRDQRRFAIELGAHWAGDTTDTAPEPLDAVIDTTPAWLPVLEALRNLRPGGRLVINAIRKEDADRDRLATLSYEDHLWMEKEIKTVANVTHHDLVEFLPLAAAVPLRPVVECYALEDANRALCDLKFGPLRGAKVLRVSA